MSARKTTGSLTTDGLKDSEAWRSEQEQSDKPIVALITGTMNGADVQFKVSDTDTTADYVPLIDPASGAARVAITEVGAVGLGIQPDVWIAPFIANAGASTDIVIKYMQF